MDTQLRRRRSLVFPLLLISLGVVFLLSNMKILPGDFWEQAGRWWPILLVIFALDDLYRGGSLIGPAFWIGLGAILLAINLNYIPADIWDMLFRFWPVIIVLAGLEIIFGGRLRSGWGAVAGILVVVVVLVGILWYATTSAIPGKLLETQTLSVPLENSQSAIVTLSPAAAKVSVSGFQDAELLAKGTIVARKAEDIRQSHQVISGTGKLDLVSQGVTVTNPIGENALTTWTVFLNNQVPIDLNYNIGVGESTLDLSQMKLTLLNVKVAVGKVTVIFPATGNFQATVEGAIGEAELIIPKGTPARVVVDNGIAGLQVQGTLNRDGKTVTTPGFSETQAHLEIHVSEAIGNVIIKSQ